MMKGVVVAGALLMATGAAVIASPVERRPVAEVLTPITGDATDLEVHPKPRQEVYSGQALRLVPLAVETAGLDASPAHRLLGELLDAWGIEPAEDASGRLVLRLIEAPNGWQPAPDQGYRLSIEAQAGAPHIVIEGGGPAGVFYGLQTLRQLVHAHAGGFYIREAAIEDWPAVPFRGPATPADVRWKLNLALVDFQWPPPDPNANRRAENLSAQQATQTMLKQIDEMLSPARDERDDLDALLNQIADGGGSGDTTPLMADQMERKRQEYRDRLARLRNQIVEFDTAYVQHQLTVRKDLKDRVLRLRDHHIEPVIAHKLSGGWGDAASHERQLDRMVRETSTAYRIGLEAGVRRFAMTLSHWAEHGYHPSDPTAPTYGELQARLVTRVMDWLKEQDPASELFLLHQKETVRTRPIVGHIASMHIRRCLDGLAEAFAAAGPPQDLQIMWAGCGEPAPQLHADHARAMSASFGGRRASFLNLYEGYGRFFIHMQQFWGGSFGIGSFIGNQVMEPHDPALAEQLTHVVIPDWGVRQWGWHPEAYDVRRVTAVKLREWLRGIGGGPDAYRELSALADWQLEHGDYAMMGLGWLLAAQLGRDQNRLTPDEVDARMTRKRVFYAERLAALRAALPPTGNSIFARIEKEVADRMQYLERVAPVLKMRPVGTGVRAVGPVTLDGVLNEPAWDAAPVQSGFKGCFPHSNWSGATWTNVKTKTAFRVVYDDDHVYVAVSCEEPEVDQIRADAGDDYRAVLGGDYLQLVIDPTGLKQQATQLTTTIHGQTIMGHEGWSTSGCDPGPLLDWQWPRSFTVETGTTDGGWVAEFAIALKDLDPQHRPAPGRRWGFNVIRRQVNRRWTSSEHMFHNPRDVGAKPQAGIWQNRFSWQPTATQFEYRYDGPTYRGQMLYCGALKFE